MLCLHQNSEYIAGYFSQEVDTCSFLSFLFFLPNIAFPSSPIKLPCSNSYSLRICSQMFNLIK